MTDLDAAKMTDHRLGVVVVEMKKTVLGAVTVQGVTTDHPDAVTMTDLDVGMMKVDHLGGGMRKKTTGGKLPEVVVVTTSVAVAVIATGTDLAVTVTDLLLEDSRMKEAGQTTVHGAVAVTTGVEEE